jgi:hypothetical protein
MSRATLKMAPLGLDYQTIPIIFPNTIHNYKKKDLWAPHLGALPKQAVYFFLLSRGVSPANDPMILLFVMPDRVYASDLFFGGG